MSDELVEKVARALAKYGRPSFPTMEREREYVDYAWRRFSDEARAAIAVCQSEPPALLPALLVVREAFKDGVSDEVFAAWKDAISHEIGTRSWAHVELLAMLDAEIEWLKAEAVGPDICAS